ncbi:UDP-N-acetylmuramoyl-tripeptide--D-alanyl-D-alanine ligase [hydrothermal vent metagenome]|uniref:UDP-MurNAc-pentapeptide synthetase n=1 Tax=hydrothermal vent metagenome TaxID=652676 RepID=A0A3B1CRW5_9ZZZZ
MIESNAQECLKAMQGELLSGRESEAFTGVSIDTRTLKAGQLFFCIQGPNFDGHAFIGQAVKKKASGIIISDREQLGSIVQKADAPFVIRVGDTLSALQDLARFHRQRLPVRVVGITGTNGKSTTKEMIASITETRFKTLKTRGNLNNHIGLPLNVLDLDKTHEVAVLEMGMSAAGEIRLLADIAKPDIGVITNISEGHLDQLKTLKNVQSAKGELFDSLNDKATAIINADDPLVLELATALKAAVKQTTFGIENPADTRADTIKATSGGHEFTVDLLGNKFEVHLPFPGHCNVYNALAAIATGHTLGIGAAEMKAGLAKCKLLSQRHEIFQHDSKTIINDTYNANPKSMREALTTLVEYPTPGHRIFVIGDMLELGDFAQSAHTDLGKEIARQPIDMLVTVGKMTALTAKGAHASGMKKDQIIAFKEHKEASDFLRENTRDGDCLLFKGSRGSGMEKVLKQLIHPEAN